MKRRKTRNKKVVFVFLTALLLLIIIYFIIKNSINRTLTPAIDKKKVTVKKLDKNLTISEAIGKAAKLLKVSDDLYRSYIGEDAIYFSFGLNRAKLELNYANAILTNIVEQAGGRLISGKEVNHIKHYVSFQDPKEKRKYVIRLYYAEPDKYARQKKSLAIVVDDFGYFAGTLLDKFCDLDTNVTFAILPGQKYSRTVMKKAEATGHESIIHMPMEPISYPKNNPGPNAIYVDLSKNKIEHLVKKYIKELPYCIGANNHMGSLVTSDSDVMRVVLSVLKSHNKFFIDSKTTSSSIAYDLARKMMMDTDENSLYLDNTALTKENLNKKIQILEEIDKDKIVIITHCTGEQKYKFLEKFIRKIKQKNFELIPVSQLFKNNLPDIM